MGGGASNVLNDDSWPHPAPADPPLAPDGLPIFNPPVLPELPEAERVQAVLDELSSAVSDMTEPGDRELEAALDSLLIEWPEAKVDTAISRISRVWQDGIRNRLNPRAPLEIDNSGPHTFGPDGFADVPLVDRPLPAKRRWLKWLIGGLIASGAIIIPVVVTGNKNTKVDVGAGATGGPTQPQDAAPSTRAKQLDAVREAIAAGDAWAAYLAVQEYEKRSGLPAKVRADYVSLLRKALPSFLTDQNPSTALETYFKHHTIEEELERLKASSHNIVVVPQPRTPAVTTSFLEAFVGLAKHWDPEVASIFTPVDAGVDRHLLFFHRTAFDSLEDAMLNMPYPMDPDSVRIQDELADIAPITGLLTPAELSKMRASTSNVKEMPEIAKRAMENLTTPAVAPDTESALEPPTSQVEVVGGGGSNSIGARVRTMGNAVSAVFYKATNGTLRAIAWAAEEIFLWAISRDGTVIISTVVATGVLNVLLSPTVPLFPMAKSTALTVLSLGKSGFGLLFDNQNLMWLVMSQHPKAVLVGAVVAAGGVLFYKEYDNLKAHAAAFFAGTGIAVFALAAGAIYLNSGNRGNKRQKR